MRKPKTFIKTEWGMLTLDQAAAKSGVHHNTIFSRIKRGWPDEKLLLPLVRQRSKRKPTAERPGSFGPKLALMLLSAERDHTTVKLAMKELRRMSLILTQRVLRYKRAIAAREKAKQDRRDGIAQRRREASVCQHPAIDGECGVRPATCIGMSTGRTYCKEHGALVAQYCEELVEEL